MSRKVVLGDIQFSDRFKEYLNDIIATERVSYGNYCRKLEDVSAERHGAKFGVLSNSGTSSLQVALHALKEKYGWENGSEVLVPATTFPATINIVLQNGLTPVFVDVDPVYYDMALTRANAADYITEKTVCLLPVNLFGQTANLEELNAVAREHDLRVLLDSCETIGVDHQGRALAEFADITCFSFYVAHIVIGGVGGVAITNDEELYHLQRSLVNHGRKPTYISIDDRVVELTDRFTFEHVGYSYRITEFEAALALAYFDDIDGNIAVRQRMAALYNEKLAPFASVLQLPQTRAGSGHAWMMYPLVIRDERLDKLDLCVHLEDRAIQTRDMLPLIGQPVAERFYGMGPDAAERLPVSANLVKNGLYIGINPRMEEADADYVAAVLKEKLQPLL